MTMIVGLLIPAVLSARLSGCSNSAVKSVTSPSQKHIAFQAN